MPGKEKRYAAGRARALGLPTRGTTAPNRLRRVDRWLVAVHGWRLAAAADPLVVDLGYGATTVTTREMLARLRAVRPDVEVIGLENDRARVSDEVSEGLSFAFGGFDLLPERRPVVVRVMNVLRQYDESAVAPAWAAMLSRLAPGGVVVEGTCDEIGRRAAWVALTSDGPASLTFSAHLASLERPSDLAERLPKALIHRNVAGEPVHELLRAWDACWARAAPTTVFGPRQRWIAAARALAGSGWPVVDDARRWRLGELSVAWAAVSGAAQSQP